MFYAVQFRRGFKGDGAGVRPPPLYLPQTDRLLVGTVYCKYRPIFYFTVDPEEYIVDMGPNLLL